MSEETQVICSETGTETDKKRKKFCCMNLKKCDGFVIRILAYIANIIMIVVGCFVLGNTYGNDSFLAMLLFVPPILSILALKKQDDREERDLKKRIRKAQLRKELKVLSEFDT
jgi:hypothetical protein